MITPAEKQELMKTIGAKFGTGDKDTGSAPVQVAVLTKRINNLKGHFDKNIHDYHSNRGLMKMIGRRRRLLKYLQTTEPEKYKGLIKELGLRK